AFHCPADMAKIDAALQTASLSQADMEKVKQLRAQGEELHKAGKHQQSIDTLAEAMKILGIQSTRRQRCPAPLRGGASDIERALGDGHRRPADARCMDAAVLDIDSEPDERRSSHLEALLDHELVSAVTRLI